MSKKDELIDKTTMLLSQAMALDIAIQTCELHKFCPECPYYVDKHDSCVFLMDLKIKHKHCAEMEQKAIKISETIRDEIKEI